MNRRGFLSFLPAALAAPFVVDANGNRARKRLRGDFDTSKKTEIVQEFWGNRLPRMIVTTDQDGKILSFRVLEQQPADERGS